MLMYTDKHIAAVCLFTFTVYLVGEVRSNAQSGCGLVTDRAFGRAWGP